MNDSVGLFSGMLEADVRVEQKEHPKKIYDKITSKQYVYSVMAGAQSGAAEDIILLGRYVMYTAE
jgi:hypothetical protein